MSCTSSGSSLSKVATVNDHSGAGDPSGAVAGEKDGDLGDILGPAGPAPGVDGTQVFGGALPAAGGGGVESLEQMGVGEARLDGVDVDLVGGVLERRRARQVQHRALGRAVARRPRQAHAP